MTAQLTIQDLPAENASLRDVQAYVSKMNVARGFEQEDAIYKMLLLTEEVGELAKAVRDYSGGKFDQATSKKDLSEELADCLIILTGVANIVGVDIFDAFIAKERLNMNRNWKKLKEEN